MEEQWKIREGFDTHREEKGNPRAKTVRWSIDIPSTTINEKRDPSDPNREKHK